MKKLKIGLLGKILIAIALGVLGLPVYALYELKEYLNEL